MNEYATFNAEQVNPEFIDQTLIQRPYVVYRTVSNSERFYFREIGESIRFYPSVTAIIRSAQRTPTFVQKKMCEMGWDGWWAYMNEKALRGTFFHRLAADFLRSGMVDLTSIPHLIESFRAENKITFSTDSWVVWAQKALLSFARFCADVNLKPIAVELVLTTDNGNFAGAIDLIAEIDSPDKKGGRVWVMIDLKSGEIYPEHRLQLYAYKALWDANFPDKPLHSLWNWKPKDWILAKSTYSYDFVRQSGADVDTDIRRAFDASLALFKINEDQEPKGFCLLNGTVKIGEAPNANVRRVSAEEAARLHIEKFLVQEPEASLPL